MCDEDKQLKEFSLKINNIKENDFLHVIGIF